MMEEFWEKIAEHVEGEIGWHAIGVFPTEDDPEPPMFTYSIGFWRNQEQPEVIIMGIDSRYAHSILAEIWQKMNEEGWKIPIGEPVSGLIRDYDVIFERVIPDNLSDWFGAALGYYDEPFPAVQMLWPDKEGHFPGEEGWDTNLDVAQPTIGRIAGPTDPS